MRSVCAVETQGQENENDWTTSYKLQFSSDGVNYNIYEEDNVDKVSQLNYLNKLLIFLIPYPGILLFVFSWGDCFDLEIINDAT